MRTTGRYCPVESDYDLEHEINRNVEKLEVLLSEVDTNNNFKNYLAIHVALIETLLKKLQ